MTTLWTGLSLGAIYAMVAIGYDLVFMASGHFNFAHAQFVTLGAFAGYVVLVDWSLPWVAIVPVAALVGLAVGVIEERVAIRTIRGRPESTQLVTTVAFAVVVSGAVSVAFGTEPRDVPFIGSGRSIHLLGGLIEPVELTLIVVALALTAILTVVSRRTLWGLIALAVAEDRQAASLRGVNVVALSIVAFAVAGLLGAVVGPLVGAKTYAVFDLGNTLAIFGFLALAIGGFGSITGSLIGGLVVGVVESVASRYLGPSQSDLIVFALLLTTLVLRPNGLFGTRLERAV